MSYLTNYLSNQTPSTTPDAYGDIATENASGNARSPDDLYADISRAQMLDWENRFEPIEEIARAQVMDPEARQDLINQGVQITTDAVNTSFDRGAARSNEQRSRSNVEQSASQAQSNDRQNQLARTQTMVQSRNQTRSYLREQENDLLMGASS